VEKIVNIDSVTNRSLQLYPGTGSMSNGNEIQSLYKVDYHFNIYLTLLPSIENATSGKIYNIGYAVFSVPYFVRGQRKVNEQKIPI